MLFKGFGTLSRPERLPLVPDGLYVTCFLEVSLTVSSFKLAPHPSFDMSAKIDR